MQYLCLIYYEEQTLEALSTGAQGYRRDPAGDRERGPAD
jgi:hypothetical protein